MDLANILGNLIDNAIEAEQKEENPYIELNLKQEKNFLNINIKNKCTNLVSINTKTNKNNSEFHGIGLKSVNRIVRKYDGEILIKLTNQEYVVNVFIQNKGN